MGTDEDELFGPEMGIEVGFYVPFPEVVGEGRNERDQHFSEAVFEAFAQMDAWAKATHAETYQPRVTTHRGIDRLIRVATVGVKAFFWRPA
jgi:hypothetical protein